MTSITESAITDVISIAVFVTAWWVLVIGVAREIGWWPR